MSVTRQRKHEVEGRTYTDAVSAWSRRHNVALTVFLVVDLILLALLLVIGFE
jgi:hypothetical protein